MRKILALIAVAAIAFGVIGASAASLGGMATQQLGATSASVESCQADMLNVSYTVAFDVDGEGWGDYYVDQVKITPTGEDWGMCQNQTFFLTLSNATGDSKVEVTGTLPNSDPWYVDILHATPEAKYMYAEDVETIALAITGPAL